MNQVDWLLICLYFLVTSLGGLLIAYYLKMVFASPANFIIKWEGRFFRALNLSLNSMGPKTYGRSLLIFHFIGFFWLVLILMLQHYLPLNPENKPAMSWWTSFNTAISFVTNTNWQAYSGEVALSYFSQMVGLTVQNFLSAGTGFAVLVALCRGLKGKEQNTLGNFWSDLFRSTVFILLPLSILWAILLSGQGVIQNFKSYQKIKTLEGIEQIIPMGPVASQVAIKQLGTNGGGYFGMNSAHPLENPTPLSNFLQMVAILILPVACVFFFGLYIGKPKQGRAIFITMAILFVTFLMIAIYFENQSNPYILNLPFWEGKEFRFTTTESTLWGVATTAASNGSVNAMHSSFSPLSGLVFLYQILLGEIIFGGVGAGMYGMILFVIMTVFLTGLMVGRTPEYLGKKIEAYEVKWAAVGVLLPSVLILCGTGLALNMSAGLKTMLHSGAHGLSEVLYAFASASGNNGSAFAGLGVDTPFYNCLLGICMWLGRFGVIIPVLAIAGSLGKKKIVPIGAGTFPTDTTFFAFILFLVIIIVGALTFFPVLCLGPVLEHLQMMGGL